MLQSLSIKPTQPVFREQRQPRTAEPGLEVAAVADSKKPLAATLEVYLLAPGSPIASSIVPTAASSASQSDDAVSERALAFSVHTDFGALRKLRSKLDKCVSSHVRSCDLCRCVSHYLSVCWERPRLLHRTWDGSAVLQMEPLAAFMNQLLRFASQLNDGDDGHQEFVQILTAFLRQN